MDDFADIDRRIERVCSPATGELAGPVLLEELGDVLARGYLAALQADARCRRLADEERRALENATRRLRTRLAIVATVFSRASTCDAGQTSPQRTA